MCPAKICRLVMPYSLPSEDVDGKRKPITVSWKGSGGGGGPDDDIVMVPR